MAKPSTSDTLAGSLTSALTYPFYRSMVRVPPVNPDLKIKLATTSEELHAAYRLLHDVYAEMGLMRSHPSGLRISVYNMLPYCSTIIAVLKGEVVGTVSIVRDNTLGLPLDEGFSRDLLRKPGLQIAEATSLAVVPKFRKSGEILFPLFKYLYHYAADYLDVNVLQIAVDPRRIDFYRAIFFFEPLSTEAVSDPVVDGALMTALYLDLKDARAHLRRSYGSKPDDRNLYKYFTAPSPETFTYPVRNRYQTFDPIWTAPLFAEFFQRRTNLLERLSQRHLQVLSEIYGDSAIGEMIQKPKSLPPHAVVERAPRFTVACQGYLEGDTGDIPVKLIDVSHTGFRMITNHPAHLAGELSFRIQVSPEMTIPVKAKVIWNRHRREWGFAISEAPRSWQQFLAALTSAVRAA